MRTRLGALLGVLLFVSTALAATLPELLQKGKDQFRNGAYEEALTTLAELETESAKPGFERDRAALEPIIAFYRGASYASIGRKDEARAAFAVFLKQQPNASLDPSMYSKKVIAALDDARKSADRVEPPEASLDAAYASFRAAAAEAAETPGEDWAEGPVRYLLDATEKHEYERMSDAAARSDFVVAFWQKRDPRPETPTNEFREDFERRVSFADTRFVQGETRGSLTDRGMVFVLLGPPTYIGRKPLTTGEDAADPASLSRSRRSDARVAATPEGRQGSSTRTGSSTRAATADRFSGPGRSITDAAANWREMWHYRKEKLPAGVPYLQVDFEFVTKRGYGENVLQREPQALDTLERAKGSHRPTG